MPDVEEVLHGGVANAGAVVRVGEFVSRPAPPHSESIHRLLDHLACAGFEAPRPAGQVAEDRETLTFVHGDVPVPPYPTWALTDEALESVGVLLRRYHEAARSFDAEESVWSEELRDPKGSDLVCHNDVCLENVVFRDGEAVALLDFDLAAPGRALWDVARTAGMCVPLRPPDDPLPGQGDFDPYARLAKFARAYGVRPDDAGELVGAIEGVFESGAAFVRRHVEQGDEGFVRMVAARGPGADERRMQWYGQNRDRLQRAVAASL